ncbi:MAG TPA: DUF4339 domain-containing protein [Bacteroidetes bacterium]|nr:DUF4339 domain-containing protein [Bacteroidota bacterium]
MESSVFLKVENTQVGPLTIHELQQMIKQRRIKPSDLIWDNQDELWLPINESDLIKELLLQAPASPRHVMAIGGGKGGVGKTSLTLAIGIALAGLGRRVILVDADFGGSNLHTYLGIDNPEYSFFDYYTMNKTNLAEIVLPTGVENLSFISGASGTLGLANPKYSQKIKLIRELGTLNADYVLLDLGAGSSYNVIDFFLAAGDGAVVSSPDPASIQETFYFIKKALMRKMYRTFRNHPGISKYFSEEERVWNHPDFVSVKELYKNVEKLDKDAAGIFRGVMQRFQPKLILNMVMNSGEANEGVALKTAVGELLSVEMDFWGIIPFDNKVREAAMQKKPFLIYKPNGKASRQVSKMASGKILEYSRLQSYLDRRKLKRLLHRLEVPENEIENEPIICSVNCGYWDDCEYQNGGYPCAIRNLETELVKKTTK